MIGVDLQSIHPLAGATMLGGRDFTAPETQQQVLELLDGKKVRVLASVTLDSFSPSQLSGQFITCLEGKGMYVYVSIGVESHLSIRQPAILRIYSCQPFQKFYHVLFKHI